MSALAEPLSLEGQIGGRVLLENTGGFQASIDNIEFLLRLRASEWAAYSRAILSSNAFSYLALGGDGNLGPFSISGQTVFDPRVPDNPFRYLTFMTSWRIGDVRLGNVFFLANPMGNSFDQVYVHGAVAGLTADGYLRFSVCDAFALTAAEVTINTLLFACAIPVQGTISFSPKTGFDAVELLARGIPLAILSGPSLETTLDLRARFDVSEKTLTPTLRTLAGSACVGVKPYVEFVAGGFPIIDGIAVYGIEFRFAIGESVSIASATCFDPGNAMHNLYVTGQTEYYERLSLAGTVSGCCGNLGQWTVDVYSKEGSSSLFGWGRLDVGALVPLGAALSGSVEAELANTGEWLFYVGFSARF